MPVDDGGQGAARWGNGEGAASQQEIQEVDDAIDPQRRLSEGDRQMDRLAKITQWYLMNGRKEEAAASAAGLLQYGAQRFGNLSNQAAVAYDHYLQTGDPKAMNTTIRLIEKAYEMVPDGAAVNITQNPETGTLQFIKTDADGEEHVADVRPQDLTTILNEGRSKSTYWDEVLRLADPEGVHIKEREKIAQANKQQDWAHEDKVKAGDRAYTEEREDFTYERQRSDDIEKEGRTQQNEIKKEQRASKRYYQEHAFLKKIEVEAKQMAAGATAQDRAAINSALADSTQALTALQAAEKEYGADSNQYNQAKDAYDNAVSRLQDLMPLKPDTGTVLGNQGIEPGSFEYQSAPYQGDTPPPDHPDAKRAPDGSWYVPDESSPSGWSIVDEE